MGERREIWLERERPIDDEPAALDLATAWIERLARLDTFYLQHEGPAKKLDGLTADGILSIVRQKRPSRTWELRCSRTPAGHTDASLRIVRGRLHEDQTAVTARLAWNVPWSKGGPALLIDLAALLGARRGTLSWPSPTPPSAGQWTLVHSLPGSPPAEVEVVRLEHDLALVASTRTDPDEDTVAEIARWLGAPSTSPTHGSSHPWRSRE